NCGFFSLSLLDEGIVEEVVLYEVVPEIAEFASRVATALGKSENSRFLAEAVSLDTIDQLPDGDVIMCQNLMHHAGILFDVDKVDRLGWEAFTRQFVSKLRRKYRFGILAVGLEGNKPANWSVPKIGRLRRFRNILRSAGWDPV